MCRGFPLAASQGAQSKDGGQSTPRLPAEKGPGSESRRVRPAGRTKSSEVQGPVLCTATELAGQVLGVGRCSQAWALSQQRWASAGFGPLTCAFHLATPEEREALLELGFTFGSALEGGESGHQQSEGPPDKGPKASSPGQMA